MGVSNLTKICALLLVGFMGAQAGEVLSLENPAKDRVLRAATKRSDLSKRSMTIQQKFDAEVIYAEGKVYFLINGSSF